MKKDIILEPFMNPLFPFTSYMRKEIKIFEIEAYDTNDKGIAFYKQMYGYQNIDGSLVYFTEDFTTNQEFLAYDITNYGGHITFIDINQTELLDMILILSNLIEL